MGKPQIPSASIQLEYPLFVCDFVDADHLVVGGGGGPGRNGVGNNITLLDVSDPTQLSEVAKLELSPNEDSVTSLVVAGPQKDKPTTTTVYAGVNSSPHDVNKGQNKHFRALTITQPGKSAKTGGVKITETTRDALFMHKDKDTYQRIVRLSPQAPPHDGLTSPSSSPSPSTRLGVVASGLSKEPQLVLFNVPSTNLPRWKTRGRLELSTEAMDLDVIQTGPDTYQLAYCDEDEIFTVEVSKDEVTEPKCVYTIEPDQYDRTKPTFKSLRYLTPGFLVTAVNQPKSQGVALHGFRLPTKEEENARLSIRAKLPSGVSKATSIAVRNLSPPSSLSDKQDDTQFVIAVAGNDSSISLYTLEHKSVYSSSILSDLAPFQVIKSVHSSSITNLSFSTFTPPKGSNKTSSEPCVKLASVAVGQSTVVHSIPLKKHVDSSSPARKAGPPKLSRYVVALKSKGESPMTAIVLILLTFFLTLFVGQVFMEAKGMGTPFLGARGVLPTNWISPMRNQPRVQPIVETKKTIENLLSDARPHHSQQMVIKHDDLGAIGPDGLPSLHVGVHDEVVHGPATEWENLEKKEQDLWKERLQKSGHWVEDMGETIFKGVLFGEIGGAIGNIVGEAL